MRVPTLLETHTGGSLTASRPSRMYLASTLVVETQPGDGTEGASRRPWPNRACHIYIIPGISPDRQRDRRGQTGYECFKVEIYTGI